MATIYERNKLAIYCSLGGLVGAAILIALVCSVPNKANAVYANDTVPTTPPDNGTADLLFDAYRSKYTS